jgi:hypothetical protein
MSCAWNLAKNRNARKRRKTMAPSEFPMLVQSIAMQSGVLGNGDPSAHPFADE